MAAANADLTRDIPSTLEALFLPIATTSAPIKGAYTKLVTQAVPSVTAQAAFLPGVAAFAATTTVTGAAVGDIVIVGAPTVALANLGRIYGVVTAADTVQLYAESLPAAAIVGASKTFAVIVLDVT